MERGAFTRHTQRERQLGSGEAGSIPAEVDKHGEGPTPTPAEAAPALLPAPPCPGSPALTSVPFSQDPHVDQYEAKEWTFIIENVSGWGGLGLGVSGTLGQHCCSCPSPSPWPTGVQGAAEGARFGRSGPGPPRRARAFPGSPAAAAEGQVREGGACRAEPHPFRGAAAGGPCHVSAHLLSLAPVYNF